jgi:heme exporter protein B
MRQHISSAAVDETLALGRSGARSDLFGPLRGYLRQVANLLWKDLVIELRTRDAVASMLVFGILSLTVFNFAFELRADSVLLVAPGVLWVAILFAGTLGLGRSYSHERDRGSLEGLMLCPVDRSAIYVGKFLANLVYIGLSELVLVPVFASFFDVPVLNPGVIAIIALGTVGFAAVGTVFGAMAVNTRAREVMLPILLLPVLVPLIIASVKATGLLIDGEPWSQTWAWVNLLVAFDVVYLVASFLLYEYVLEDWG